MCVRVGHWQPAGLAACKALHMSNGAPELLHQLEEALHGAGIQSLLEDAPTCKHRVLSSVSRPGYFRCDLLVFLRWASVGALGSDCMSASMVKSRLMRWRGESAI